MKNKKIFAFDSIAFEYMHQLGFANIWLAKSKCKSIHSVNNINTLPEYLLDIPFNANIKLTNCINNNETMEYINNFNFDLIVLPSWLKDSEYAKSFTIDIVYYGTELNADELDKNNQIVHYIDDSNNKWEYVIGLQSLKFLAKQLAKKGFNTLAKFEKVKIYFLSEIAKINRELDLLFNSNWPTISLITNSDVKKNNFFVASPGLYSVLYYYSNFKFKLNLESLKQTIDGVTSSIINLEKNNFQIFDYVFTINNTKELKNLYKQKVFKIGNWAKLANSSIIGMLYLLKFFVNIFKDYFLDTKDL